MPLLLSTFVGDSTFFHSGVTGLLDIAYNKGEFDDYRVR